MNDISARDPMPRKLNLVKHLTRGELEDRYRREKKDVRLKERLQAILLLYDGKRTEDVAGIVRRARSTIENWIGAWNERGVDGLIPNFTGGPKPRMADSEWDKIVREIEGKGMTLRDVEVYVKDTRGVHYAYKTVWKALRKERKVRYGKAYKMNAKRPQDAEGILKKN
jgi:putative transposase